MVFRHWGSGQGASRRLAAVQALALGLLVAVCVAAVLWISDAHNRLAARDTHAMIAGGVAAAEDKLRALTLDHAIWHVSEAEILAGRADWFTHHMSDAAATLHRAELMAVFGPEGAQRLGWIDGAPAAPGSAVLPAKSVTRLLRPLPATPANAPATARYARLDDAVWLLVAARVRLAEAPGAAGGRAYLVTGQRLDRARLAAIGGQFLVAGLRLQEDPGPGQASLALPGVDGAPAAHLVWTPPRPGDAILTALAPALAVALVLALAISFGAARYAQRVERERDAARAANQAKSAFLANVSHELRTPMNGILGMSQLIEATRPEPRVARMLEVVMASARSQLELIDELLDTARIDAGDARLAAEPFDPAQTAHEVCELLAAQAAEKGLALRVTPPPEPGPLALGDRGRFHQIVTNLVANAIKFTEEGEVAVTLDVRHEGARLAIALDVADTGPGIERKDQERIFERFVRSAPGRGSLASGTGLGLSITRSLVELMGGRIGVESAPGEGAVFHVALCLPAAEAGAEAPRATGKIRCVAAE